ERVTPLGNGTWRVEAGLANTGWLGTTVTVHAEKSDLVQPITAEIAGPGVAVAGGPARVEVGQLEGRAVAQSRVGNDGTPDRALVTWVVTAPPGTTVEVVARHDRAGEARRWITLA
ncbi:MAG: hypothetical protein MUE78_07025, partial [Ilumatobacteraceae bacterium]|nr:hypothetical protein [Ilumatobacteraceae bacterium]